MNDPYYGFDVTVFAILLLVFSARVLFYAFARVRTATIKRGRRR